MEQIILEKIIKAELEGLYGSEVLEEFNEIIRLYDIYEGPGQDWLTDEEDYIPTKKKVNYIKKLIKEEARFLFGKAPTFTVTVEDDTLSDQVEIINKYINKLLKKNLFEDKLIKAARDCFIGKRIAIKLHADKTNKSIRIMFIPSLEFVYEPFDDRVDELQKIIFFYQLNQSKVKNEQRIWKQKYEMVNDKCILNEGIYDGYGNPIEITAENKDLQLTGIPAYVILNDGLLGDLKGESDVEELFDSGVAYNKLASEDIDALRKGMNRAIYGIDVSEESSKHFELKPGAYWDVETDQTVKDENRQAQIGTVDTDFGYDARMENTLNRIKSDMHELLNIPLINNQDLKGMMTSGKSMKALYWQLITRCEEKMKAWKPALEWMIKAILEMTDVYSIEDIPKLSEFEVVVENQYPLQEDEYEEKNNDMQQVNTQVMSRKSYIKKWSNTTDEIADEELKQIQLEKQLLEDSYNQFETIIEDDE
ncbi:phage portal protein [Paraclostridium sordellii 8483]|uniref:phage portal protein n=1 Tax=Paraclostridium sordellii TaxID=1505 RepID=UPI000312DBA1|nr:phage portal protein [Paeniclostridium sordellii]TAN64679.1 phage portal protein [Paeniclostridium sordellii 8483]